jgi:hypothetical protein
MQEDDATVRERVGATDAMPKRKRLSCHVKVGTFKNGTRPACLHAVMLLFLVSTPVNSITAAYCGGKCEYEGLEGVKSPAL